MWCLTYDMRFLPLFSPLLSGFFWLSGNREEGRIKEITNALFAPLTLILLLAASPFLPPPAVKAKASEPGAVQAPVEEEGERR